MTFKEWIETGSAPPPDERVQKSSPLAPSPTAGKRHPARRRSSLSGLDQRLPVLTRREKEIVQLLRLGYSNKEIAGELAISVTTVKWNITNILGKFGVETSKQLIVLLSALDTAESRYWMIE